MFRIASAICFAVAICFEVWGAATPTWNWVLMMLIGLLCWALSDITGK